MSESKNLKVKIEEFKKNLPYTKHPYSKKTWGHPRHSLCSYQGKLKPSLAFWLVKEFVPEGGSVIDPIGGVGTIPFEAALSGRFSVSNDKSPFAAIIAMAKISNVSRIELDEFMDKIKKECENIELTNNDFSEAEFGLNANITTYYHPETLKTILKLRRIFLSTKIDTKSLAENFFWSCLLHVLHGNRPYALSRKSHPITPFAPTGDYLYKDVFEKVYEKSTRVFSEPLPDGFIEGRGIYGDFREIPKRIDEKFDAVITSPPFYGMRFDRPNWLRLWFCGWNSLNFKNDSIDFLERQQIKNISVYKDFFDLSHELLKKDGVLILHLGKGGARDMTDELKILASSKFNFVDEIIECVKNVSNHGIKDKGMTTAHALLFFTPI